MRLRRLVDQAVSAVLDAVNAPAVAGIRPFIADEPVRCCVAAGKQRGVAGRGEGGGMAIMGIGKYSAVIHQITDAVGPEALLESPRHVAPQLVDRQKQNEFG